MIKLIDKGIYVLNGREFDTEKAKMEQKYGELPPADEARRGTIAYSILKSHNLGNEDKDLFHLKFDALTSHDITFVNVIQTARASGLEKFPVPYVLTNCHNSLCAVGGTINEDDHRFGLSAAKKYGGVFVPAHMAVIHQVMRELYAGCGKMILGTDSHTRYGAIGTMGIGEGGGEMVKQLLSKSYDVKRPEVIGVYLTGKPIPGVGPHDVALAIVGATFGNGFVKNKVMEFIGDGIANLSMDFRNGIDVMTTETSCLSSIWETDDKTKEYLDIHNRADEFKRLQPEKWAYYDGMIFVDLSEIRPMIALPFHPSNTYQISELNSNLGDILRKVELEAQSVTGKSLDLMSKVKNGKLMVDQGVIAGCAGGSFENIMIANHIIGNKAIGSDEFALSVYPSSQPVMLELMEQKALNELAKSGATIRSAFCGPCFGAGDVPFNNALSIRHTTRNFPYREGARPADGQIASVALMDARSIAATAVNGGVLTAASDIAENYECPKYKFDDSPYKSRIYNGWNAPCEDVSLAYGPNIVDWPEIPELAEHLLLKVVSYIDDPVTTTDELIPSGETSSYRSNPLKLAEFTLSRRDPEYVNMAKKVLDNEKKRQRGETVTEFAGVYERIQSILGYEDIDISSIGIGSVIYATKPGDGSAREQAASCQRVLGGSANIARDYATKRYRSNLINWGIIPFIIGKEPEFNKGDYIFLPNIKKAVAENADRVEAYIIRKRLVKFELSLGELTSNDRNILLAGCLINDYRKK